MTALEQQLKNPVWYSLNETHKKFAVKFKEVLFYDQEVCTFGAFFDEDRTTAASNQYLKTTDSFFFVSENKTPKVDSAHIFLEKKIPPKKMIIY